MTHQTKSKPFVSCIIIFFNAKKETFFEEAIESIFAQTYDNWELLLADDGSTDESTSIALHYAQKYPTKVRYVEHEGHQNRGMSATRNLGIRHAKGEYVAFLDSDDVWLPSKLEQQLIIFEDHPEAAMVYGRTLFWFSWMENNPLCLNDNREDYLTLTSRDFDTIIKPPRQLITGLIDINYFAATCSVMVRRNIFAMLGGFEDEFRSANEDRVFFTKIFLHFPVYVSSQCWDRYRRHSDSYYGRIISQPTLRLSNDPYGHFRYMEWLETYLIHTHNKDIRVWFELTKALLPYRHPRIYKLLNLISLPKKLLHKIYRTTRIKLSYINNRAI